MFTQLERIERFVFTLTGFVLPSLRKAWKREGAKLQTLLDYEHSLKAERI